MAYSTESLAVFQCQILINIQTNWYLLLFIHRLEVDNIQKQSVMCISCYHVICYLKKLRKRSVPPKVTKTQQH